MSWTVEQVLALAPDASSAKAGKDLAAPRKWRTLGATDACAWGTIQGSGAAPYQTSIDLAGPAFKCTCPSRKFPCKHGLGLLLILAQQPEAMAEKAPPAWTAEWLARRADKQDPKPLRSASPAAAFDPEAEAKSRAGAERRAAARESKVTAGLEDLGVWLEDLVRGGLATLPGKPSSFWETPAARLVDAQAPGLARRVRALEGLTTAGDRWPARLLHHAALLHLAREGWTRRDALPVATQADLRATIGFVTSQEEVLAGPGVRDEWTVVGRRLEAEDQLRVQRTWLLAASSQRAALCLSFSAGANQPLDVSLVPGTTVDAELVFFPSAWPLRALVKQRYGPPSAKVPVLPDLTVGAATAFAAAAFSANPWIERVLLVLTGVTPFRRAHGWRVRDATGRCLPLEASESQAWVLVALSGGQPLTMAGEWNGECLYPLSVWAEGRFTPL